jgi:hypothetical protein
MHRNPQCNEIGIRGVLEPAPTHDKLLAVITDMSNRSPKGRDTELEVDEQNLKSGSLKHM